MKTVAIIPAGGKGLRFSPRGEKKQFVEVGGAPLIVHTLRAVQASPLVDGIILVVPEEDREWLTERLASYGVEKVKSIVPGGAHRQDSVWAGIRVADEDADILMIHDGARPLITTDIIGNIVMAAAERGAAITAVPVTDTVKLCRPNNWVIRTLPRSEVYLAQTPQAFRRKIIVSAYEAAYGEGFYGTDDASLVERMGVPVYVVAGSYRNVKVTTWQDLPYLRFLMSGT
ncbi:MAG TPA: 2-C-methyl-D-erythritol 4-phosphate cytidylyltransferase [Syntrophales bacterium]|nr:2-C-methyl-D-erythritol 4-phosphate cytidylyltransferase [Syntrophales bacterium]HOL58679.1 2-C-methyl-D-erythritol 4-phosphate cytidylyltransferase [Syntrophales bacterium]HPO35033.1 2-C-methyl-D-erythritol 4-phosphate cytidylyltransferase [Syntrophales bacterium]